MTNHVALLRGVNVGGHRPVSMSDDRLPRPHRKGGRSRLTHALIEKKLGIRGTGRNWNTVLKLAGLVT